MPAGQKVELLVSRRRGGAVVAVPAWYDGDVARAGGGPTRRLTEPERVAVVAASRMLSDAFAGIPIDEIELQSAVELLHRLAGETEGEPSFRLADGRTIGGDEITFRADLS